MTMLGDKLAAARAHQGWSLREAEKRTGVPNAHLSQLETGTIRRPGLETLLPLAAAYGIPVDELAALAGHDVTALHELSGNGVRVGLITAADPGVREWMDADPRVSAMLAKLCANPDRDILLERIEEVIR
jgi:transcriptional regulator with XRE-family HTH domain